MPDKKECQTCKFGKVQNGAVVQCRRYPPNINGWPFTALYNWCGEYKKGDSNGN